MIKIEVTHRERDRERETKREQAGRAERGDTSNQVTIWDLSIIAIRKGTFPVIANIHLRLECTIYMKSMDC